MRRHFRVKRDDMAPYTYYPPVLNDAGPGFAPGPCCGLGRFYPMSEDEARAVQKAPRKVGKQDVPSAKPGEVGDPD